MSSEGKRWSVIRQGETMLLEGPPVANGSVLADASEVERLRSGIEDYLLWEPGRRGHAEAHRRLAALLHPDEGQT